MSELLVSIDLGTTRLKVAAFLMDGTLQHLVVRRHEDHRLDTDAGARHWQVAESWWEDAVTAVRELLAVVPAADVQGIGLSGRGGAAVFADRSGEVLADPWSDGRHAAQARQLRSWRQSRGVHLSNAGLGLIAKYRWLVDEHPDAAEEIHRAFFAKDWLLFKLTGVHKTDWTSGPDAASWDGALAELELPADLLPTPALPWALAGGLTDPAAELLGLVPGLPVAVGAHDGLAANIGAGASESGTMAITVGTHAVVRSVQAAAPPGAYRFYGLPPAHSVIGGNAILAGRAVDWLLDMLGIAQAPEARHAGYRELEEAAAKLPPGASGVRFLPFLAGRVAPEQRPGARGLFSGIGLGHGRDAFYRAVLEGGAFAIRDIFTQVGDWCGAPAWVRVTGGGAESRLWMEILAGVLGIPLELTGQAVEARGAAVCLSIALGRHADLGEATAEMVRVTEVVEPTAVAGYQSVYEDWRRINLLSRELDQA